MKACLICWKKAKGKTQKCIVVVKGLRKDWDGFYSEEMCPSFSLKKEKKKSGAILWNHQICKKGLLKASHKGWVKITTGASKGLQRGEIQLQSVARLGYYLAIPGLKADSGWNFARWEDRQAQESQTSAAFKSQVDKAPRKCTWMWCWPCPEWELDLSSQTYTS